jgi:hypothetical protein
MCEASKCIQDGENFIEFYNMLFELVSLKLQGRKHVDIRKLQDYTVMRYKLTRVDVIHCKEWIKWFCATFDYVESWFVQKGYRSYRLDKKVKLVEQTAIARAMEIERTKLKKANFTFLCCICTMPKMYKDLRRLLFWHVCVVQEEYFEKNIKELDKFIWRNCKNKLTDICIELFPKIYI